MKQTLQKFWYPLLVIFALALIAVETLVIIPKITSMGKAIFR